VYLHPAGDREGGGSLILRYEEDYPGALPIVKWLGADTLSISVGSVSGITKLVSSLYGVHIIYAVGKELHPRSEWVIRARNLKLITAGVAIFDLVLLAWCRVIIVSIRKKSLA
jgi:hypothetical protein